MPWMDAEDVESERVHLTGIIVRDLSCVVSNYRSKYTLDEYLKAQKVPGIANLDTRAITRRLRETGAMNGVIAIGDGQRCDCEFFVAAGGFCIYFVTAILSAPKCNGNNFKCEGADCNRDRH